MSDEKRLREIGSDAERFLETATYAPSSTDPGHAEG